MKEENNFYLQFKEILCKTFILTGKIYNKEIIENLTSSIKKNIDPKLHSKTCVKAGFTGFQSLVEDKYFINFLTLIKQNIKMIYPNNFIISEAWGNFCKKNDQVTEHDHRGASAFCGILYLSEGGPGTFFPDYEITIEEEIGKFILFSPILRHSVKKIEKDIERISLAFNMASLKTWQIEENNITWVNKNEI
jgi:hypothetical protein